MLYEVEGNLVRDDEYNIFCHQTNCMGVMGSGIAKQIADKYPVVQIRNADRCKQSNPLGTILVVRVAPQRFCVNMYGQYNYGREFKVYTDYEALQKCFDALAERLNKSAIPDSWKIGFPNRMSCGLGGGSWNTVRAMIEDFSNKVYQNVYIVHRKDNRNDKQKAFRSIETK